MGIDLVVRTHVPVSMCMPSLLFRRRWQYGDVARAWIAAPRASGLPAQEPQADLWNYSQSHDFGKRGKLDS